MLILQKTKNALNKIKERSSIAGAIVKLIEKTENNQSAASLSANMSMMLICQMEAINQSMDKRACQEEKEERRKRRHHKKCRAKKGAKKMARKAALEGLPNYGGKAGGSSSSNSSSSSSDSNSSDSNSSSSSSSIVSNKCNN
jgi:hypothetical protein